MRFFVSAPLIALLGFVTACGGGAPAAESPAPSGQADLEAVPAASSAATASPATFSEQVALGQRLYGEKCAGCHGASGEGKKGPPVVGLERGALPLDPPSTARYRKNQFKTVMDIAEVVVTNMPPDAPGSLSEEEYFSILAFDLKANGIDLADKKLDAALARTLEVPR
jgi:mono/diheme cytochrome c family protein